MAVGLATFINNGMSLGPGRVNNDTYTNVRRLALHFTKGTIDIELTFPYRREITVQFDTAFELDVDEANNIYTLGPPDTSLSADHFIGFFARVPIGPGLSTHEPPIHPSRFPRFLNNATFDFVRGSVEVEQEVGDVWAEYQLDSLNRIMSLGLSKQFTLAII